MRVLGFFMLVVGMRVIHPVFFGMTVIITMPMRVAMIIRRFCSGGVSVVTIGMRINLAMRFWFWLRMCHFSCHRHGFCCNVLFMTMIIDGRFMSIHLRCMNLWNDMHVCARMFSMDRFGHHGCAKHGSMSCFLGEVTFAPIDKTIEGNGVIIAPDERSKRQKKQCQTRCENNGGLNAARQINGRHNRDARKSGNANRQHQRLNAIRKITQKTEYNEYAEHGTQCGQSVLQRSCARIAHIESVGKCDGAVRIKYFGSGPRNEKTACDQPEQKQRNRLHIIPR